MLDNVKPLPGGEYEGRIGQKGLAFVRNLLALTEQEKLIVVCTHIPLTSSHSHDPSCTTVDADLLLKFLHGRKAISFSGICTQASIITLAPATAASSSDNRSAIGLLVERSL